MFLYTPGFNLYLIIKVYLLFINPSSLSFAATSEAVAPDGTLNVTTSPYDEEVEKYSEI